MATGKVRIESDYKRRKRITEDVTKMRSKLIKDDIKRHEDTETKRQQQTDDIVRTIQEGNRLIMAMEENNAKQSKVLDTVAILLQKLVEK